MFEEIPPSAVRKSERRAFIAASGRFLAFPLAGAIIWAILGVIGLTASGAASLYCLLFGTGLIFPLALLIARFTGQQVFVKDNTYATLMGMSVLMVNLLWPLHFFIIFKAPTLAPLSIAIALGLHWIVFGWIIRNSLGVRHTLIRTTLCVIAQIVFPENALSAIAACVVISYGITILELLKDPTLKVHPRHRE